MREGYRNFRGTIRHKKTKQDANGNDYLILELEDKTSIFVFSSQVSSSNWDNLKVDQTYQLAVKRGKNHNNILVSYKSTELEREEFGNEGGLRGEYEAYRENIINQEVIQLEKKRLEHLQETQLEAKVEILTYDFGDLLTEN